MSATIAINESFPTAVTDFGLSRILTESKYYFANPLKAVLIDGQLLRYTREECWKALVQRCDNCLGLNENKFSTASDVWVWCRHLVSC